MVECEVATGGNCGVGVDECVSSPSTSNIARPESTTDTDGSISVPFDPFTCAYVEGSAIAYQPCTT